MRPVGPPTLVGMPKVPCWAAGVDNSGIGEVRQAAAGVGQAPREVR